MARERWFYSQNHQRRGPVPLNQLVESVLAQKEPRSTLIWRKGFADWTRAEDIPEVERRIVPFLTRKEEEEAARRPARPASTSIPVERAAPPPPSQSIPALLYGGIAAGVAATGFVAWLLWPSAEPAPQPLPLGGTSPENAPAVVIPGPGSGGPPAPAPPAATTPPPTAAPATPPPAASLPAPTAAPPVAAATPPPAQPSLDQELDVPKSELGKLRQVAAWSGTTLELTVYNGTAFRVTEVFVTVQRFVGDDMVDDDTPIRLLPPAAGVDAGVASLLNKVAPERAKPGVNPLDTGKFAGTAGPPPEAYRCQIVAARGYATR
jgi:hypothetical protein